jgi:hypothetical protein
MPLSTYPLVPWIRTSNCTARCRTSAGKILGLVTGPSSLRVPHLPWRGMDDRAPVMLLSDGYLANGSEPWRVPATADDGTVTAEEKDFWPYRVRDQPAHRLRLPRPVPHQDLPPGRTTHLRRPGPRPDRHRQAQRPPATPGTAWTARCQRSRHGLARLQRSFDEWLRHTRPRARTTSQSTRSRRQTPRILVPNQADQVRGPSQTLAFPGQVSADDIRRPAACARIALFSCRVRRARSAIRAGVSTSRAAGFLWSPGNGNCPIQSLGRDVRLGDATAATAADRARPKSTRSDPVTHPQPDSAPPRLHSPRTPAGVATSRRRRSVGRNVASTPGPLWDRRRRTPLRDQPARRASHSHLRFCIRSR